MMEVARWVAVDVSKMKRHWVVWIISAQYW